MTDTAATEALARGDWATAQRLFEQSLAVGETAEALEGLGTAAFFLGDGELAIATRERAYALYREAGRPVDAARVAIGVAWDQRTVRLEPAVAAGWLARARRLLEDCGPTAERGVARAPRGVVRPPRRRGTRT